MGTAVVSRTKLSAFWGESLDLLKQFNKSLVMELKQFKKSRADMARYNFLDHDLHGSP